MPIVPLHAHAALTRRITSAIRGSSLPQSLLIHGESGIGKQRLALWIAASLLCERGAPACGTCRQCRYMAELNHPDFIWVFPRPRMKDADASTEEVRFDLATAIKERVDALGLYAPPPGTEGIYVPTIRAIVRAASVTPALARRKVIVVGEAERMVSQEGSDQAANAFLKLLEEPHADTWVILTSSAPGALLPTIRSRVVALRARRLTNTEVEGWLAEPGVADALTARELPGGRAQWVEMAAGAPGRLLVTTANAGAAESARRIISSVASPSRERETHVALTQGSMGARGKFSDVLEAVAVELRASMQAAASTGKEALARNLARCIEQVEDAKVLAYGNVNPQLIASELLTAIRQATNQGAVR